MRSASSSVLTLAANRDGPHFFTSAARLRRPPWRCRQMPEASRHAAELRGGRDSGSSLRHVRNDGEPRGRDAGLSASVRRCYRSSNLQTDMPMQSLALSSRLVMRRCSAGFVRRGGLKSVPWSGIGISGRGCSTAGLFREPHSAVPVSRVCRHGQNRGSTRMYEECLPMTVRTIRRWFFPVGGCVREACATWR